MSSFAFNNFNILEFNQELLNGTFSDQFVPWSDMFFGSTKTYADIYGLTHSSIHWDLAEENWMLRETTTQETGIPIATYGAVDFSYTPQLFWGSMHFRKKQIKGMDELKNLIQKWLYLNKVQYDKEQTNILFNNAIALPTKNIASADQAFDYIQSTINNLLDTYRFIQPSDIIIAVPNNFVTASSGVVGNVPFVWDKVVAEYNITLDRLPSTLVTDSANADTVLIGIRQLLVRHTVKQPMIDQTGEDDMKTFDWVRVEYSNTGLQQLQTGGLQKQKLTFTP